MLFSRYNLLKNHGEFVHLNMLKWALKFVPELGKKTVTDDETVKSMDIGKGGIDIDTVNDETHVETVKHIPFSSVEHDGVPQATVDFRTDLKDDVRTATFDDGTVGHFDQYTKVSTSSDPDKVIPAVRFDDSEKVKVDNTEDSYVDSFQSLSKDYDGNLTPEGVTKLKPYTSVLRDDDSTASKVKIEHDDKNKLTALSMPTTGEKYTVQSTNVQTNGKTQDNVKFKTDSKDDVRSVTFDDGKEEHFDQYTKVSTSSDPGKVIPAVRFDNSEKVKVDGTEDSYVESFESLSKDDDGNLMPAGTTKLKPYTSVLRDDESTASKVKIEHDSNNLLTALSLPATGEKYTIPAGAPASKSGTSVVDADNTTQVADTASLKGDANGNLTSVALSTGKNYTVPKGTAIAPAGFGVLDKIILNRDSDGNLLSLQENSSTGYKYKIPQQKPSTAIAPAGFGILDKIILNRDSDGNLLSLQENSSTGYKYKVPKYTDVVDADNNTQAADKASLKGDANGNLTSIALSTGKTFNIPQQPVIPKHTDVVDADNAAQVADKASLKGDSKGNLTSIALSTGKTFNIPKHADIFDYVDGDQAADVVQLYGDSNDNLISINTLTGTKNRTYNIPWPQGGSGGSGTKIVTSVNDVNADKVSGYAAYDRIAFHKVNVKKDGYGNTAEYIDAVDYFKNFDGNTYDGQTDEDVGRKKFRPYTSLVRDGGRDSLIQNVQIKTSDISSENFSEGGDTFLKGLNLLDEYGANSDKEIKILRPFKLKNAWHKRSGTTSNIWDPEVWQDFDKLTIDVGDMVSGAPGDGTQGQKINAIHLSRFSHTPGDITTTYDIDISSLNLIIKEHNN